MNWWNIDQVLEQKYCLDTLFYTVLDIIWP